MGEQIQGNRVKGAEFFHRPNPYGLVALSTIYDYREIVSPPRNYIPATNPEEQLVSVTADLQRVFGRQLMFVGLTGSRSTNPALEDSDLDVLAIVGDDTAADRITFHGDLKIVSYSGLREFIEYGHQLIATQFRKAQPIFQGEGTEAALNEAIGWRVVPEKAIPFLIAKSKFNEQTSDINRLMSNKYRAIFLHLNGMEQEAFAQLREVEQDELFNSIRLDLADDDPRIVYLQNARFYSDSGLNRMFQSISEMLQALYIKEVGDIPDVKPLTEWAEARLGDTLAGLYEYIYEKRAECYKGEGFLTDGVYGAIREGIRATNPIIERMVLGQDTPEEPVDEQPNLVKDLMP